MDAQGELLPYLSAIVPFHRISDLPRVETWILEAIATQIEIILVLDSLTVEEVVLIKKTLGGPNSYLKIIEGVFGSAAKARNQGMTVASAEWITFWDADDLPETQKSLQVLSLAGNSKAIRTAFERKSTTEEKLLKSEIKCVHEREVNMANVINLADDPGLWRWFFDRTLAQKHSFPEIIMAEDQIYLIRVLSNLHAYSDLPIVTYQYNDLNDCAVTKISYQPRLFLKSMFIALKETTQQDNRALKLFLVILSFRLFRSAIKATMTFKRGEK